LLKHNVSYKTSQGTVKYHRGYDKNIISVFN
jgi:hypothetical protein